MNDSTSDMLTFSSTSPETFTCVCGWGRDKDTSSRDIIWKS